MPLVRFEVRNEYGLGDPELYRGAAKRDDPRALLDGVAVAGLAGILRQLGDLAEFAAEVFHDLHEQVIDTSARGKKMLTRIQHIEEVLPSLENAVQEQTSHIHFAYIAGSDWHANLKHDNSHLLSSDLPRFMLDSYEECRDPPRLYLLDKFDSGGTGACLRRYSDPTYFKRIWTASELEKSEKVPREKKPPKSKELQDRFLGISSYSVLDHLPTSTSLDVDDSSAPILTLGPARVPFILGCRHEPTNSKKRSQLRSREVQPSVSMFRHHNSIHFASPNSNSRSFSVEDMSISDMRLKPEHVSESTSSGSRTRMSATEEGLGTNPSVAPDEVEYDKISVTKSQINHSDSGSSLIPDDTNHDVADGVSHHGSLLGSAPRSPSVTWDEKTEIIKPSSPKSCDDILVGGVLDSEPLPETSEPSCMDNETAELEDLGQDDILLDILNAPVSLLHGNHFDEVTSEADNYMDALNTLEPETETDSEYQTKRERRSLSKLGYQGTEAETRNLLETAAINSDSSDIETPVASSISFGKKLPPEATNLAFQVNSEQAQSPLMNDFSSVDSERVQQSLASEFPLDMSSVTEISKNVSDTSEAKGDGGLLSHLSPNSNNFKIQTISYVENTGSSLKSSDSPFDNSGISSTKLWTNAGLFGVEPSKPPDFSVPNIVSENGVSGSKYTEGDLLSYTERPRLRYGASFAKSDSVVTHNNSISRNSICFENTYGSPNNLSSIERSSLNSDQLCSIIYNVVQPNDQSKCPPSMHERQHGGKSVSDNSQSLSQLDRFGNTTSCSNHAYDDRHCQQTQDKLPEHSNIQFQPCESGKNEDAISSSFSGLAQRFLANSLQNKAPVVQVDSCWPSRGLNDDPRKFQEASLGTQQKEELREVNFPLSYEQITKEKNDRDSFQKSISSGSHYSETSSPPLEHMKISFYPMNGLETSKLKLEFPSGNLHENNEDLMFPSFQLLPGPVILSQDCGWESDDDTFCRSCPYSSEDIVSPPRSYSNSEFWDQDERSVGKDHEIYDDSRGLSSSTTSNSSFMGFEQISPCNVNSASGLEYSEPKDVSASCQSGPIVDIPGIYSVIPLKNQQEMQCDSLNDHVNSTLRSPNELPQPPPLPPMQWRVLRSSFPSNEDKVSSSTDNLEHSNYLEPKGLTVQPQENEMSVNLLCINETEEASSNLVFAQDQQKLNGKKDPNHDLSGKGTDAREELLHQIRNKNEQENINGHSEMKKNGNKEPDEREELLHQIKNKTFNLRRTVAAKPSLMPQPATNVNVAAILEKANAIRQAFVGSDDDGDDDKWSDG